MMEEQQNKGKSNNLIKGRFKKKKKLKRRIE